MNLAYTWTQAFSIVAIGGLASIGIYLLVAGLAGLVIVSLYFFGKASGEVKDADAAIKTSLGSGAIIIVGCVFFLLCALIAHHAGL